MQRRRVLCGLGALAVSATGIGRAGGQVLADDGKKPAAAVGLEAFEMPPEAAPHTRTLMQWPVSAAVYGRRDLAGVQKTIAAIANAISRFEPVAVMASQPVHAAARPHLNSVVELWDIATDDLWCRDSGPTFVTSKSGALAVSHVRFNGWGNKQRHRNDGRIAERVAARLNVPLLETGLIGEQGGIEHDGAGTLIAHASSWINVNRTPGNEAEVAAKMMRAFGARKVIWAPGIKGADITDYHIDALARFTSPGHVLIQLPDKIDPHDPWSKAAYETYGVLKGATDAEGRKLEIVVLPEPVNTRVRAKDFVASYVNYYVCNGAVISAEFGDDRADAKARELLAQLYPGREVVALNVDPLGRAGGGIHCATQQQPQTA